MNINYRKCNQLKTHRIKNAKFKNNQNTNNKRANTRKHTCKNITNKRKTAKQHAKQTKMYTTDEPHAKHNNGNNWAINERKQTMKNTTNNKWKQNAQHDHKGKDKKTDINSHSLREKKKNPYEIYTQWDFVYTKMCIVSETIKYTKHRWHTHA